MSSSGRTHHRGVDRSIASSRAPRLEANADRSADVCGDFGRPSRQSEGGEALLLTASELHQVIHPAMGGRTEPNVARWFVLWTRSHCERSEERRVGKECRSRWARCHEKKKME